MVEDMSRRGVSLAVLIIAMLLLSAFAMGIIAMMADAQRQYLSLGESNQSLYTADAGMEWAIRAGRTTTNFPFGGGTFTVTKSGQPGDAALGTATSSVRVEIYRASAQWTSTGRYGNGRRIVRDGTNSARAQSSTFPTDGGVNGLAAGDLDGDGDIDLVAGTANGKLQVLINDGTGAFTQQASSPYATNSAVAAVGLADMNGDGSLDIVCVDNGTAPYKLEVWTNNGSAVFTLKATYSLGGKGTSLAVKDVDGNGTVDVVVGTDANQFEVWKNDGTGALTQSAVYSVNDATVPNGIVLSDVDLNGSNDVMLVTQGKHLEKWLNNGTGTFTYTSANILTQPALSLAAGNFDGVAGDDIVVGEAAHRFVTYFNNGSGTFTLDSVYTSPLGDVYAIALYDMDGDGYLDVVLAEASADRLQIYLNNGSGTFTLDSTFTAGGNARAVAAADFNYGQ